jgi:hypothetical protein
LGKAEAGAGAVTFSLAAQRLAGVPAGAVSVMVDLRLTQRKEAEKGVFWLWLRVTGERQKNEAPLFKIN